MHFLSCLESDNCLNVYVHLTRWQIMPLAYLQSNKNSHSRTKVSSWFIEMVPSCNVSSLYFTIRREVCSNTTSDNAKYTDLQEK